MQPTLVCCPAGGGVRRGEGCNYVAKRFDQLGMKMWHNTYDIVGNISTISLLYRQLSKLVKIVCATLTLNM